MMLLEKVPDFERTYGFTHRLLRKIQVCFMNFVKFYLLPYKWFMEILNMGHKFSMEQN